MLGAPDPAKGLVQALGAVINAASFSSNDKQKLLGLVQSESESESHSQETSEESEEDTMLGAPDPAKYKTHSTSIVDVLEDLKEKAEAQLADLRKAETSAQHNFDMPK